MKTRLSKILEKESEIMIEQFMEARKLTKHSYQQGYFYEELLRLFLQKFFPPSIGVARGFIVDSDDNISNELDIIIFDKNKTPVFYSAGDLRIIPIETVYAVIEVKTKITSSIIKKQIFPHLESINVLNKKALLDPDEKMLDTKAKKFEAPIMYGVFAFSSSKLSDITDTINDYYSKNDKKPKEKIDSICVLGKGVIFHMYKVVIPFASSSSEMKSFNNTNGALKWFFGMINDVVSTVDIKGGIRYSQYFIDKSIQNKK